jgi:hypothetical protein
VSRVLLAKAIQLIAGALETTREERGEEVIEEDDLSAVDQEVELHVYR